MKKNDFERAILAEVDWCRSNYGFSGNNQEKYEMGFIAGLKQAVFIIKSIKKGTARKKGKGKVKVHKKKPTKIKLSFSVSNDDPLKNEIFKAFGELMKLLKRNNDEVCRTIDKSAKEADKLLKEGRRCCG